jgi:acetyltransferase
MTVRNLDFLLKPRSVALIGASRQAQSIGATVARNLFGSGFDGPVMPVVTAGEQSIQGTLAYRSISELPMTPELAVICTPAATVPSLVADLGARGTKAAVVVTAHDANGDGAGDAAAWRQAILDAARPHLLRVLGPDSLGLMVPGCGLNASFAHVRPLSGDIAMIGQSGTVMTSVVDWATAQRIGFSHLVSLGDMADVDFGDLLDYLATDSATRAILLYVETVNHARKFMSAARAAARAKPVIVIKSGRYDNSKRTFPSYAGALVGSDEVYDAAFRRAGMLRVDNLGELFDAVETLAWGTAVLGDRLAILTNGAGLGMLATDALVRSGGRLAALSGPAARNLAPALPAGAPPSGNPVVLGADAGPGRYRSALTALLADEENDAVLVLHSPTAVADGAAIARAVAEAAKGSRRAVLTSWLGGETAAEARRLFTEHRIPTYATPDEAIHGFLHLLEYRRNQATLMQTPPSVPELFDVDLAAARAVVDAALGNGRSWLTEAEAKQVVRAYGVPIVETRTARTPEEAAEAAAAFGRPVALKILSADIAHKSEIGGVSLNLTSPDQVRDAARMMLAKVAAAAPAARIDGFTVQEMAGMPGAIELIVGAAEDPLFGPVILFGEGGTDAEALHDVALALPPLNLHLARETMARTRVHQLLVGFRARPPAALDAIAVTLMKIAQLVIDIPDIAEIDVNPLLADANGVLALDARIRVAKAAVPGARRLAIRPYPKRLEKLIEIPDGRRFLLRPIRPEDEPLLHETVEHIDPEDLRLRFFTPMKRLPPQLAARLTQIDYDREMALVAVTPPHGPDKALYGVVRLAADPDNRTAEYAVIVRSDMKGKGLGYLLMKEIIAYARERGIAEVRGTVLRDNTTMLRMAAELGFARHIQHDDPGLIEVRIDLTAPPSAAGAASGAGSPPSAPPSIAVAGRGSTR